MGILDDLVGKVKEAVGGSGGTTSGLVNEVLGLLSGQGQGGGLQGLIRTFQDKGLGDLVSSWVGTGQNLPINGQQMQTGLGADLIGQLATKVGLPPDIATAKLTEILPTLIDKLTPEGKVPDSATLQQGLELLRTKLGKG